MVGGLVEGVRQFAEEGLTDDVAVLALRVVESETTSDWLGL